MNWPKSLKLIGNIFDDALNTNSIKNLKQFLNNVNTNSNFANIYNRITHIENNKFIIIVEENQDCVFWGIKEEDYKIINPSIYIRENNSESTWQLEWTKASNFFLAYALWQAVNSALKISAYATNCESTKIHKIKKKFSKVQLSENPWYIDFYMDKNNETILAICGNEIFLGCKNINNIIDFNKNIKLNWSYSSLDV